MLEKKNLLSDLDEVLYGGTYPDVIAYADFSGDRLRRPLTFDAVLTTLSH